MIISAWSVTVSTLDSWRSFFQGGDFAGGRFKGFKFSVRESRIEILAMMKSMSALLMGRVLVAHCYCEEGV
jgi:hypothetical protein